MRAKAMAIMNADLRRICVTNSWYTCGTNEEYAQLFEMNSRHVKLHTLAVDILKHSGEDADIQDIMEALLLHAVPRIEVHV